MKMPQTPPDMKDLMHEIAQNPSKLLAILSSPKVFLDEKYLHWDKLFHLQPPEGFSHREWWFALKAKRSLLYREIPLQDRNNQLFRFAQVDQILESLNRVDELAIGRIALPEQITDKSARSAYAINAMIEESIASSQLEGAATTRQVAKEMIRSGRSPRDTSERMILNNYETMCRIASLKDQPLRPELIFEIHRLITDGTLPDPSAAGRFRLDHERVEVSDEYGQIFHIPPKAEELEVRLAALCDFANQKTPNRFLHPILRAIILHFWLAYDHPFVDGNGRTARALFYWSMLHQGFWLFEFVCISRILRKAPLQYAYAFLLSETDDNDLTYFILHSLDVIQKGIRDLYAYADWKTAQIERLDREISSINILNHRQQALIAHALRHPHHKYTIRMHQKSHAIVYETARKDLLDLADSGLLCQEKIGKAFYFIPAENLKDRLQGLGKLSEE